MSSHNSKANSGPIEANSAMQAVWHLRTIMESASDAIISVDLDGTILSWNYSAGKMLGYSNEEAVGESIAMIYARENVPDIMERIRRGEYIASCAATIATKSGSLIDTSLVVSPIVDSSEKLFGASMTLRNDTELKETREALTWLAKVFVDAADPIVIENVFGRVVEVNTEAELTYGYTRDELLGEPIKTIIPPERHEQADQLLQHCLQAGQVRNVESVRKNKSGETFPVLLTLSLITNEFGKTTGIATICKNISDQKRTEKALRQAVRKLERSNEELNDLMAIMSHDLRSPLITISGFAEMVGQDLKETSGTDDAKKNLSRISEAARRMKSLIDDLVTHARTETPNTAFGPVDLNGIVKQALANLEYDIRKSQARIEVPDLPEIPGEETGLRQLFQNLIANAVKFCGDDVPAVSVSADEEGDMWHFIVKDNGIGIKSEFHDSIFSPFKRLHSQSEYKGSGIGLATCRKIVEQHEGSIWVESEPGNGAIFHFTLPVSQ